MQQIGFIRLDRLLITLIIKCKKFTLQAGNSPVTKVCYCGYGVCWFVSSKSKASTISTESNFIYSSNLMAWLLQWKKLWVRWKDHTTKSRDSSFEERLNRSHAVYLTTTTIVLVSPPDYYLIIRTARLLFGQDNPPAKVGQYDNGIERYAYYDMYFFRVWNLNHHFYYETRKSLPTVKSNALMKGVDRRDQMLSYYSCERKHSGGIRRCLFTYSKCCS